MYKLILSKPLDCNISTIAWISKVSSNKNHVTNIITDINIPVIKAILIPFFEGILIDIGFFSTLRYQIVGTKKIHILHAAKNICENNSSSMILMPKITDIDGHQTVDALGGL